LAVRTEENCESPQIRIGDLQVEVSIRGPRQYEAALLTTSHVISFVSVTISVLSGCNRHKQSLPIRNKQVERMRSNSPSNPRMDSVPLRAISSECRLHFIFVLVAIGSALSSNNAVCWLLCARGRVLPSV